MGKITSQVATLGSVGGLEEDAAAEERVCDDCWATLGGAALGGDEARASTPVADGRDDATYAVTVVQAARRSARTLASSATSRQPSAFVELRGSRSSAARASRAGSCGSTSRASPAKRQRRAAPRPPRCADIDGGSWPARLDALYPPGSAVHGACFVAFAPGQYAPRRDRARGARDVSGSASPRAPRRRGALLLTSHRLLFVPEASDGAPFFVPHATCLDVRVEAPPPGSNTDALALCVVTRDFRKFEFTSRTATNRDFHWYRSEIRWRTRGPVPPPAAKARRTEAAVDTAPAEAAEAVSEPPADSSEKPLTKRQQRRVALKKFLKAGEGSGPTRPAGADVDLLAEFRRQGVLDDHRWRLTETNALYALCPTYPSTLVVPAALTDAVLADAARWRSKARVPVLTWYNRASGAPICRSSQPHAGLTDKVMAEDEASLMHLRAATSRTNAGRLLADSFDDDGRGAPATPGKDDGDSDDDVVEISAVCGLAQFLLDPYCRTIDGFGVLVEKDWCAFGHMFRERGGFGSDPQQETGPIFLQFLDAVSQIMWQCPTACEFTEEFLEVLADAERSRWFANFLRDSDRDRARENSGSPRGPGRTPRGAARPRPEENDEAVSIWRVFAFQRDRFSNARPRRRRRCGASLQALRLRPSYLHAEDVSPEVAALRARIRALEAERAGDDDGFHDSDAGFHGARAPRSPQLE
ncbi:phosphatidylinositol-3,5-bisphosphate 3-phosphatase [Aureococcus anophagefferens]|nr:phosphatidylinositol-3,5-bisphosphate 3-phosphatase [Aureococcus anophagefferens]